MGKRIVKNYPSPRLMETIGATNQKPAEAIGELVANSFDARIDNERIKIVVDMRNQKIVVIDNGKGMTSDILEKAVCIGEDMSRYMERGEGAKGHFGMGFKTSCSTLGRYYEIFTRPDSENREYHVGFDIGDYSKRPSGSDAWDIEIEDNAPSENSPLKNMDHGTAFVISKLKDKNIIVSAVLSYLGEAFKGHLQTGDSILIVDAIGTHEAVPKKYSFIKGTKIEIDEVFGPNDKYHITGWMALDEQLHNDGIYGFNIYRYGQLVVTWDKSWFKAHLMTSRIIGEVNMDFLDATFYKQGVQQSEDWQLVAEHMKEYLKGIVSASRNVSKQGNINKPAVLKKIVEDLNHFYNKEIPEGESIPGEEAEGGNDSGQENSGNSGTQGKKKKAGDEGSVNEKIKAVVKEQALVLENEGIIDITYLEKDGRSDNKAPFDYIFDEADADEEEEDVHSELQVIMFKNHPLWSKKVDDEVKKILATSDAIYRMLVEKLDFETSEALKIRNEWIGRRTFGESEQ